RRPRPPPSPPPQPAPGFGQRLPYRKAEPAGSGSAPATFAIGPGTGAQPTACRREPHSMAASGPDEEVVLPIGSAQGESPERFELPLPQGQALVAEGHAQQAGPDPDPPSVEPHQPRAILEFEVEVAERRRSGLERRAEPANRIWRQR